MTRLATARAALRAHLSPVMSRDSALLERLEAEVDAAATELWLSAVDAIEPADDCDRRDFGDYGSACAHEANSIRWWDAKMTRYAAEHGYSSAVLSRHNRDTAIVDAVTTMLRWLATLPVVDDMRDLDFDAPLQRRTRRGSGIARTA